MALSKSVRAIEGLRRRDAARVNISALREELPLQYANRSANDVVKSATAYIQVLKQELLDERRRRRIRETNATDMFEDEPTRLALYDEHGRAHIVDSRQDLSVAPRTYTRRLYSNRYAPPPYSDGDSVACVTLDDSVVDAVRRQLNALDETALAKLVYTDGHMADVLRLNKTSSALLKDLGGVHWYGPFSREVERILSIFMDLEPNHSTATVPSTMHYILCRVLEEGGYSRVAASYLLQTMMDERSFDED